MRWWDGQGWTEQVSTGGVASLDPPQPQPQLSHLASPPVGEGGPVRSGGATPPVSFKRAMAARALDQFAVIGAWLYCFGLALLLDDVGDGRSSFIGFGVIGGMVAALICLVFMVWAAVRRGTTAGLFVLGLRIDPQEPLTAFDAFGWMLEFWQELVLVPAAWLFVRLLNRSKAVPDTGVIRDPRPSTGGARLARAVLAILIGASPLPSALAILS